MRTKIYHSHIGCKFYIGGLLVVIGLLLLGLNLGIITPALKPVIFSWQMLLILLGISSFFHRHFWSGTILFLIGGFFIIPRLQTADIAPFTQLPDHFTQTCYPFLLIAAGVLIIVHWLLPHNHKLKRRHLHYNIFGRKKHKHKSNPSNQTTSKHGFFERSEFFSSGEYDVIDEVFKGGRIEAVFGGSMVDLRHTTLPEGETHLEISCIFSGVQIFVPQSWNIELRTNSILGGFGDMRIIDKSKIDHSRKLIISGSFVFGGGELKN